MYDFDRPLCRTGTSCVKWDRAKEVFQTEEDILPMWIADMDFPLAPAIAERLARQIASNAFGYGFLPQEAYEAVMGWMEKRHKYPVEREWFCFTPGVVAALFYAVDAFSQPGEGVMFCPPVYGAFFKAVESQGRKAQCVPLLRDDQGHYTFDFEGMERAVTPKTRILLLCSPHNPVGRVWQQQELEQAADFALRHNLIVAADEIHHDIVFGGRRHLVFGKVSPEIARRCVICTAPSKTFNIAGMHTSCILIPDPALRERFQACARKHNAALPHAFSGAALIGAYGESEDWVDAVTAYIDDNHAFLQSHLEKNLPQLSCRRAEATYLAWLDCSALGLDTEGLKRFFVEQCRLGLNAGVEYGAAGEGFMRMNLACPRSTVEQALGQISSALQARERG